MPEVIARYRIIVVVNTWIIDKPNKKAIGRFKKYGIALIIGILYKITKRRFPKRDTI